MTDIHAEDIAAMRAEGTLRDYIRMATGRPPIPAQPTPRDEPEPEARLPRARVGAWPDGTRSPGPVTPPPVAESLAALDEYRQWLTAGRPSCDMNCNCAGCAA